MLAYLFWHCPRPDVEARECEHRLLSFHAALAADGYTSASFRLGRLPFDERPGHEDWYLVKDWNALGELNEAAVAARSRSSHDAIAELASEGWGGLYRLLRGDPAPPARVRWLAKPEAMSYADFPDQIHGPVWQRQLVLGPAAEFCVTDERADEREQLWPCGTRRAPSSSTP